MLTHKSSTIRNSPDGRITFNFDCESMSESLNYISGFCQVTFTLSDKQIFAKLRDNYWGTTFMQFMIHDHKYKIIGNSMIHKK